MTNTFMEDRDQRQQVRKWIAFWDRNKEFVFVVRTLVLSPMCLLLMIVDVDDDMMNGRYRNIPLIPTYLILPSA